MGFRWFVLQEASGLGLTGWVRNRRDGTVELEAQGGPESLGSFKLRLETGNPHARVSGISAEVIPARRDGENFEIRESGD